MVNRQVHPLENTMCSEKIMEALAQLKFQEHQLIHLLFVEGCSLDEIVLQLGVSKSCLEKRRERTLVNLNKSRQSKTC